MRKIIVVYESKYGSTKRYAEWISDNLSCPLIEKQKAKPSDLENADIIIYGGGLYAGGVSGINLLVKNWNLLSDKKIILFTCGLADPCVSSNVEHIREALTKSIPSEMYEKLCLFHLRGGINYSKLNFIHKTMMSMLRKMLLNKGESELSSEDKELLETYGKEVDFTDLESALPLVEYTRTLP